MDLQQEWANMGAELGSSALYDLELTDIRKTSKGLLETLVKGLKTKMVWIRVFSVPALAGALFAATPLKYVLIGVFLAYEIGRWLSMQKLKHININIDYADVTSEVIASQLTLITQVLRIEQIWGYIFLPLSAPLGFIMAIMFSHRNPLHVLQQFSPAYWISIYLLIVAASFLMTRRMNKIAFGRYIDKLKEKAKQLDE